RRSAHINRADTLTALLGGGIVNPGPKLSGILALVRLRERGTVAAKLDVLLRWTAPRFAGRRVALRVGVRDERDNRLSRGAVRFSAAPGCSGWRAPPAARSRPRRHHASPTPPRGHCCRGTTRNHAAAGVSLARRRARRPA